jgi:DNA polymerase III epsilon subunit family exonuclease
LSYKIRVAIGYLLYGAAYELFFQLARVGGFLLSRLRNYFFMNFQTYIALDLETTGVDAGVDKIIEVGAVKVENGKIVDRFESFVAFDGVLDPYVTVLTGIRQEDLVGAPGVHEVLNTLQAFIGTLPIVGHNIAFDIGFLQKNGLVPEGAMWDTNELALVLLRHLPSYSLEALMKRYSITHDAHRALADAEAAHELWQRLLFEVTQLDASKKHQLADILVKSEWSLAELWSSEYVVSDYVSHDRSTVSALKNVSDIQLPDRLDSLMIECFGYEPLGVAERVLKNLLQDGKKTLMLASQFFTLEMISDFLLAEGVSCVFYDTVDNFLDWRRFISLTQQNTLSVHESMLVVQVILHYSPDSIIHQRDLQFSYSDNESWGKVAADADSAVYTLLQDRVGVASVVLMSQQSCFRMAHQSAEFIESFEHVISLDPEAIESSVTYALGDVFASRYADKEYADFFDLFRKWVKSVLPESPYPTSYLLHNDIKRNGFDELLVESEKLKSPFLTRFFEMTEGTVSWFKMFPSGDIVLYMSPLDPGVFMRDNIFSRVAHTLVGYRGFMPSLCGFDGGFYSLTRAESIENLTIVIPPPERLLGENNQSDIALQSDYFFDEVSQYKTKAVFIFGSRHVLKQSVFHLQPQLIQSKIPYIAESMSGGRGKMLELYQSYSENDRVMFFATHRFLPFFHSGDLQFDSIFFQALPFDPPGDPVHQLRSQKYKNSFLEYALPKAVQSYMALLSTLSMSNTRKKVYFLDPLLPNKSYFSALLDVLPEGYTIDGG